MFALVDSTITQPTPPRALPLDASTAGTRYDLSPMLNYNVPHMYVPGDDGLRQCLNVLDAYLCLDADQFAAHVGSSLIQQLPSLFEAVPDSAVAKLTKVWPL